MVVRAHSKQKAKKNVFVQLSCDTNEERSYVFVFNNSTRHLCCSCLVRFPRPDNTRDQLCCLAHYSYLTSVTRRWNWMEMSATYWCIALHTLKCLATICLIYECDQSDGPSARHLSQETIPWRIIADDAIEPLIVTFVRYWWGGIDRDHRCWLIRQFDEHADRNGQQFHHGVLLSMMVESAEETPATADPLLYPSCCKIQRYSFICTSNEGKKNENRIENLIIIELNTTVPA